MKTNPYERAESILGISLICLAVGAMLLGIGYIITVEGQWIKVLKGLGWILGFVALYAAVECFVSWWGKKKHQWDERHSADQVTGDIRES